MESGAHFLDSRKRGKKLAWYLQEPLSVKVGPLVSKIRYFRWQYFPMFLPLLCFPNSLSGNLYLAFVFQRCYKRECSYFSCPCIQCQRPLTSSSPSSNPWQSAKATRRSPPPDPSCTPRLDPLHPPQPVPPPSSGPAIFPGYTQPPSPDH